MRRIVLDTETTGLEPSEGHRVIEIACVELFDRRPTGRNFHRYLNPERDIDIGATQVHGLTRDFLADMLEVLSRRMTNGVGQHRLADWPPAF